MLWDMNQHGGGGVIVFFCWRFGGTYQRGCVGERGSCSNDCVWLTKTGCLSFKNLDDVFPCKFLVVPYALKFCVFLCNSSKTLAGA